MSLKLTTFATERQQKRLVHNAACNNFLAWVTKAVDWKENVFAMCLVPESPLRLEIVLEFMSICVLSFLFLSFLRATKAVPRWSMLLSSVVGRLMWLWYVVSRTVSETACHYALEVICDRPLKRVGILIKLTSCLPNYFHCGLFQPCLRVYGGNIFIKCLILFLSIWRSFCIDGYFVLSQSKECGTFTKLGEHGGYEVTPHKQDFNFEPSCWYISPSIFSLPSCWGQRPYCKYLEPFGKLEYINSSSKYFPCQW